MPSDGNHWEQFADEIDGEFDRITEGPTWSWVVTSLWRSWIVTFEMRYARGSQEARESVRARCAAQLALVVVRRSQDSGDGPFAIVGVTTVRARKEP